MPSHPIPGEIIAIILSYAVATKPVTGFSNDVVEDGTKEIVAFASVNASFRSEVERLLYAHLDLTKITTIVKCFRTIVHSGRGLGKYVKSLQISLRDFDSWIAHSNVPEERGRRLRVINKKSPYGIYDDGRLLGATFGLINHALASMRQLKTYSLKVGRTRGFNRREAQSKFPRENVFALPWLPIGAPFNLFDFEYMGRFLTVPLLRFLRDQASIKTLRCPCIETPFRLNPPLLPHLRRIISPPAFVRGVTPSRGIDSMELVVLPSMAHTALELIIPQLRQSTTPLKGFIMPMTWADSISAALPILATHFPDLEYIILTEEGPNPHLGAARWTVSGNPYSWYRNNAVVRAISNFKNLKSITVYGRVFDPLINRDPVFAMDAGAEDFALDIPIANDADTFLNFPNPPNAPADLELSIAAAEVPQLPPNTTAAGPQPPNPPSLHPPIIQQIAAGLDAVLGAGAGEGEGGDAVVTDDDGDEANDGDDIMDENVIALEIGVDDGHGFEAVLNEDAGNLDPQILPAHAQPPTDPTQPPGAPGDGAPTPPNNHQNQPPNQNQNQVPMMVFGPNGAALPQNALPPNLVNQIQGLANFIAAGIGMNLGMNLGPNNGVNVQPGVNVAGNPPPGLGLNGPINNAQATFVAPAPNAALNAAPAENVVLHPHGNGPPHPHGVGPNNPIANPWDALIVPVPAPDLPQAHAAAPPAIPAVNQLPVHLPPNPLHHGPHVHPPPPRPPSVIYPPDIIAEVEQVLSIDPEAAPLPHLGALGGWELHNDGFGGWAFGVFAGGPLEGAPGGAPLGNGDLGPIPDAPGGAPALNFVPPPFPGGLFGNAAPPNVPPFPAPPGNGAIPAQAPNPNPIIPQILAGLGLGMLGHPAGLPPLPAGPGAGNANANANVNVNGLAGIPPFGFVNAAANGGNNTAPPVLNVNPFGGPNALPFPHHGVLVNATFHVNIGLPQNPQNNATPTPNANTQPQPADFDPLPNLNNNVNPPGNGVPWQAHHWLQPQPQGGQNIGQHPFNINMNTAAPLPPGAPEARLAQAGQERRTRAYLLARSRLEHAFQRAQADAEREIVSLWEAHCPTLRRVVFRSGQRREVVWARRKPSPHELREQLHYELMADDDGWTPLSISDLENRRVGNVDNGEGCESLDDVASAWSPAYFPSDKEQAEHEANLIKQGV